MGAVVELKRRDLDGQPLPWLWVERDIGERPADVPRSLGAQPPRPQQMRHQRRRRGFAVRAGDGDAADALALQRPKTEIELRDDLHAGGAGGGQWRGVGWDARRSHDPCSGADPGQIVTTDLDSDARESAQRGDGGAAAVGLLGPVARVYAHVRARQQRRRSDAALAQPDNRHLAAPPGFRYHRTFSVARAIAAHITPSI